MVLGLGFVFKKSIFRRRLQFGYFNSEDPRKVACAEALHTEQNQEDTNRLGRKAGIWSKFPPPNEIFRFFLEAAKYGNALPNDMVGGKIFQG